MVNQEYCGKLLHLDEGKKCSWHYHENKHETFYLLKGSVVVTYGTDNDKAHADSIILLPGGVFEVPIGLRHQVYAREDSVLIEFSTHHEDSDSHRIEQGD